jgi:hypothetical protein
MALLLYPRFFSRSIFLAFVISFPFISFYSDAQILVGPVAGGQFNWMVFDDQDYKEDYNLKPQLNYHVGGSIAFRAQKRFFLHTSFLYTQKGKSLESTDNAGTTNNMKLKYLDVPILYTAEFKAKLGREKVFKWYFGVGPTVSYWLGGKGVLVHGDLNENGINPPNYDLSYKITFKKDPETVQPNEMNVVEPNRIQLGLNASAGLIFEPVDKHRVMVNLRYSFGQSFLSKEGDGQFGLPGILFYEDELQVRSRELILSAHYFIDLKTSERKKGKSTLKVKSSKKK